MVGRFRRVEFCWFINVRRVSRLGLVGLLKSVGL